MTDSLGVLGLSQDSQAFRIRPAGLCGTAVVRLRALGEGRGSGAWDSGASLNLMFALVTSTETSVPVCRRSLPGY